MNILISVLTTSVCMLIRAIEFLLPRTIRKRKERGIVPALLVFLAGGSITVSSAHGNNVAVLIMPFENASGRSEFDDLARNMPDLLTACFSEVPNAPIVVERTLDRRAMDEIGGTVAQFSDPKAQLKAGAVVGADVILRGSINLKNGDLDAEFFAFNVTDTSLVATQRARLESGAIIDSVCKSIAATFALKLGELNASREPLGRNEDAAQQVLLMEGLKHYYSGDYASAIAPFLKLMRLAPDSESAQYWLGQSFVGAGLNDLAALQMQTYLNQFPGHARSRDVEVSLRALIDRRQ